MTDIEKIILLNQAAVMSGISRLCNVVSHACENTKEHVELREIADLLNKLSVGTGKLVEEFNLVGEPIN